MAGSVLQLVLRRTQRTSYTVWLGIAPPFGLEIQRQELQMLAAARKDGGKVTTTKGSGQMDYSEFLNRLIVEQSFKIPACNRIAGGYIRPCRDNPAPADTGKTGNCRMIHRSENPKRHTRRQNPTRAILAVSGLCQLVWRFGCFEGLDT